MKKLFIFIFLPVLFCQNSSLFIDGVAAVVEDKIVLKSDLNQMVNMMAIQQNINPNEKTIVFCANQPHAAKIRDYINKSKY